MDFPGASVVKNLPANAGDAGSIPGWERSPEEEKETHSSILAWEISWTEDPGGLRFIGMQSQTRLKRLSPPAGSSYLFFQEASVFSFPAFRHCPR